MARTRVAAAAGVPDTVGTGIGARGDATLGVHRGEAEGPVSDDVSGVPDALVPSGSRPSASGPSASGSYA